MSEASIRYACITSPGMDSGIAFPYLKAIDDTGLGVRIMPIGLALFDRLPWSEISHVFTTSISDPFINVVCVPLRVTLGAPVSAAKFVEDNLEDSEAALAPESMRIEAPGNVEGGYEPETAIVGLHTDNVFNVIIVDGTTPMGKAELLVLGEEECLALCRYSRVICSTHEATTILCKHGVPAATIPPESDKLAKLFADFLV